MLVCQPPYRHALRGMKHIMRMTALNPNTGVGWNSEVLQMRLVKRLNKMLRQMGECDSLPPAAQISLMIRQTLG